MSSAEPVDELADVVRMASGGADPGVTHDLVEAACGKQPHAALEVVAASALEAGMEREDVIRACNARASRFEHK